MTKGIKKQVLTATLMLVCSTALFSQIKDIGKFTVGGVEDAQKLMGEYVKPWANALGTSLSGGWYNTAKVHKLGGFDLTLTFNMGFVPPADKTFNLDELGLTGTYSTNTAPTAAGKNQQGPEITYTYQGYELAQYNTPRGTGLGFIPSPMLQAGVGLVKGTEINGRYMPGVELGNIGSFGLWGVGLKHDILQWLPFAKKIPVLNVALQGGYTKLNYKKSLSFLPSDLGISASNVTVSPSVSFDNQSANLTVQSFTANLLVSANLPVVCFYGGLGIANTNTELGLKGYYPIPTINSQGEKVVTNESVGNADPVTLKIKNNDGSPTKPRFNVGMRLKLGVITIHGDYTKANYSNVTVGLGVSIR
jgi:hypothetical protein